MALLIACRKVRHVVVRLLILLIGLHDFEDSPAETVRRSRPPKKKSAKTQANQPPPSKVARQRLKLLKATPRCGYCGMCITDQEASIDHILARSRGGRNIIENMLLACCDCNSEKSDRSLIEWRDHLNLRMEALYALHWRDISPDVIRSRIRIQAVLKKIDTLLTGNSDRFAPLWDSGTRVHIPEQNGYPKLKSEEPVSPKHFVHCDTTYAMIDFKTGQPLLLDAFFADAVKYLMANGSDPNNPLRLIGYQEMINPAFNAPDWRIEPVVPFKPQSV